jgi:hypothetical protein
MKKMSTKQKTAHNRVTAKRRKSFMKRRAHVAILKAAYKKSSEISRQLEKIRYRQVKAAKAAQ